MRPTAAARPERVPPAQSRHAAGDAGATPAFDASFIAELERIFAHAPVAIAVTEGPMHALRYANAPFRRLQSSGEITISRVSSDEGRAVDLAPLLDRAFRRVEIVRDDLVGSAARWSCTAWPIATGTGVPDGITVEVRDAAYIEGIRARQRVIAERLLLRALRDQDAAMEARASGERASFLATLGRDLAMSLDQDATREIVRHARLTRRDTWCIVDLLEPNGMIHRLAVVHPDPAKQELAAGLADRWYQSRPDGPIQLARVSRPVGGLPLLVKKDGGAVLDAVARGPQELATLRELGFENLLVVPLVIQSRVLGAITFVTAEGDAPLETDDIALASDLADRCAMALDHARLYHEAEVLRVAADAANEAKSEFLGRMSHELRTPLAAIGGFVELLRIGTHGLLNDEQRTDLDRIRHNQRHLAALITQVLTFVRAEGGRIEYHCAPMPIRPMLAEVAGMLDEAVTQKELALQLLPGEDDAVVWADPDRVRQILMNLLSNAIKFTPRAGGTITLDSSGTEDSVRIHVSDPGPGIAAAKLEEIFEPFVQLAPDSGDRQGGVGLGLAISRDLARAMRGDITVESIEGVGSRFTLTLPRGQPDAPR